MSINISCTVDYCPMCKSNDPPLSDKRSSLSCVGCDTRYHKKCARNLSKTDSGTFSVCCDDSEDRSILAPPSNDDDESDLDLDSLPDSLTITKEQLNSIINQAASKAAKKPIKSFSASIDSVNARITKLDSKTVQLEITYKELAQKIQQAESSIKNSFETNCDLMYAEFSNRESRKHNVILHNLTESQDIDLKKQVSEI